MPRKIKSLQSILDQIPESPLDAETIRRLSKRGEEFLRLREYVRGIVELFPMVSRHVQMRRSGRCHIGHCPFHDDKTGSFYVFPSEGHWRCHGSCNTGGDIVDFMAKMADCSVEEALLRLKIAVEEVERKSHV